MNKKINEKDEHILKLIKKAKICYGFVGLSESDIELYIKNPELADYFELTVFYLVAQFIIYKLELTKKAKINGNFLNLHLPKEIEQYIRDPALFDCLKVTMTGLLTTKEKNNGL